MNKIRNVGTEEELRFVRHGINGVTYQPVQFKSICGFHPDGFLVQLCVQDVNELRKQKSALLLECPLGGAIESHWWRDLPRSIGPCP